MTGHKYDPEEVSVMIRTIKKKWEEKVFSRFISDSITDFELYQQTINRKKKISTKRL